MAWLRSRAFHLHICPGCCFCEHLYVSPEKTSLPNSPSVSTLRPFACVPLHSTVSSSPFFFGSCGFPSIRKRSESIQTVELPPSRDLSSRGPDALCFFQPLFSVAVRLGLSRGAKDFLDLPPAQGAAGRGVQNLQGAGRAETRMAARQHRGIGLRSIAHQAVVSIAGLWKGLEIPAVKLCGGTMFIK